MSAGAVLCASCVGRKAIGYVCGCVCARACILVCVVGKAQEAVIEERFGLGVLRG